jgi:1-pyrroline-4-hydroxy-2-carboxylate deaminase
MNWFGVLPAMTTPFDRNLAVDHTFLAQHAAWLLSNGCSGLVMAGSLGEGATLVPAEKLAIIHTAVQVAAKARKPVIAAVSALATAEAVKFAQAVADAGCAGLMVLPPYVYASDWREMKAHVSSVIAATGLPCMLYNNPVAYKTDFLPVQIKELAAEHENLEAIKESSADVRRIAAIRELLDDRLSLSVGVDDMLVEAVNAGATGWVAGLANAFPAESVELFTLALDPKRREEAFALYRWFLPLLRMDTVPKFVQLIKWVQSETGTGSANVRGPRMVLEGAELKQAQQVLATALANRPAITTSPLGALQEA